MAWTSASHKNYHRDYFSLMYTCLVSGGKGSYINVLLLLMIYRTSEVPSYFNWNMLDCSILQRKIYPGKQKDLTLLIDCNMLLKKITKQWKEIHVI